MCSSGPQRSLLALLRLTFGRRSFPDSRCLCLCLRQPLALLVQYASEIIYVQARRNLPRDSWIRRPPSVPMRCFVWVLSMSTIIPDILELNCLFCTMYSYYVLVHACTINTDNCTKYSQVYSELLASLCGGCRPAVACDPEVVDVDSD